LSNFWAKNPAALEIIEELSNVGIEAFREGDEVHSSGPYCVRVVLPGKAPPAPLLLEAYREAVYEVADSGRVPLAAMSATIDGLRQTIVTIPLWAFLQLVQERD
jgi:hypothetical protein